jgi:capsular polysaccharide biosynthesis protein
VAALGLTAPQRADVTVTSDLLPGTNVVEIVGESRDPILARDFTDAVGAQTVSYVGDLYETYRLEPLDTANLTDIPIAPNKPLNLTLGAILGLVLGIGFALLAAYLQAPVDVTQALPPFESGAVRSARPLSEQRDLASV